MKNSALKPSWPARCGEGQSALSVESSCPDCMLGLRSLDARAGSTGVSFRLHEPACGQGRWLRWLAGRGEQQQLGFDAVHHCGFNRCGLGRWWFSLGW